MPPNDRDLDRLTESIIGHAFTVANTLGIGFVEKVYENALTVLLRQAGFGIEQQRPVKVRFVDELVGRFVADIVVERSVVVELKAVSSLHANHVLQCRNYLKASGLPTCLLLNFGARSLEIRRLSHPG